MAEDLIEKVKNVDKKKVGFWITIGAFGLIVIGVIVMLVTGGKYDALLKKALELLGKSKAKDEDRSDAIKEAEEQIKENEKIIEKAKKKEEEAKKDTENFKEEVKKQQGKSSIEDLESQLEKNKKLLE
jgi:hypothetical protein